MPSFPLFGVGVFTIIDGICQEKVARFEKFLVEKTQGRFSRPAAGRADSPAVQRMVGGMVEKTGELQLVREMTSKSLGGDGARARFVHHCTTTLGRQRSGTECTATARLR
jgi:hypothetical protein